MKINNIGINLKKDKIVLKIAEKAEFVEIVEELKKKLQY